MNPPIIFEHFKPILLEDFGSEWDRLWLVILIIKLPRVSLVALPSGIGIILSYIGYLHWKSVSTTTPISKLKFFAKHIYSSVISSMSFGSPIISRLFPTHPSS